MALLGAALAPIGCGDPVPPLDELALRDALQAAPEAIAGLPEEARIRLAARLEAARRGEARSEQVAAPTAGADAPTLVRAVDGARAGAARDALVVAELAPGSGGVSVYPVPDAIAARDGAPLPSLELAPDAAPPPTAALEARALEGTAGDSLRALAASTGARRLVRVTGWPAAAVAVGDTIYVNAAWLVALAPAAACDGTPGAMDLRTRLPTSLADRNGGTTAARSVPRPSTHLAPLDTSPTLYSSPAPGGGPRSSEQPSSSSCDAECAAEACVITIDILYICAEVAASGACEACIDGCEGLANAAPAARRCEQRAPAARLAWLFVPLGYLTAASRRRRRFRGDGLGEHRR